MDFDISYKMSSSLLFAVHIFSWYLFIIHSIEEKNVVSISCGMLWSVNTLRTICFTSYINCSLVIVNTVAKLRNCLANETALILSGFYDHLCQYKQESNICSPFSQPALPDHPPVSPFLGLLSLAISRSPTEPYPSLNRVF